MPATAPTARSSSENIGHPGIASLPLGEGEVAAIAVHVLAEQRHLGDPLRRQVADLVNDVGERPADLGAAYSRNDAERTCVVAADLDRDPRVEATAAARRQCTREQSVIVDDCFIEDLGDRSCRSHQIDQLAGAMDVVGAEDHVDPRRTFADAFTILLGHAPRNDELTALDLILPTLEVTEIAVRLGVGPFADATRVDDDHVSFVFGGGQDEPIRFEQPCDALRVVLVHLAPVGADGVATAHGLPA